MNQLKNYKMTNKQLLLDILHVQSESYNTKNMEAFILRDVESLGLSAVCDNGNIYVTKGNASSYPCIVSHTDTVHKIIPDGHFTIIANDEMAIGYDRVKMKPSGCGGDDKVGIFVCLQLLRDIDNIKVAFFRDEEVGCVGSYEANIDFFKDCRFVLQCDRRGNNDFVDNIYSTPLQSKKFKKDVKRFLNAYGYKPTSGMLTDVYALKQLGVNVSVANMSCGYYNPHCDDETIVFEDVENCLNMCYDIMLNMTNVYEHTAPVYNNTYSYYGYGSKVSTKRSYYDWDDWLDNNSSFDKKGKDIDFYDSHEMCECCNEWTEVANISLNKDYAAMICDKCSLTLV